MATSTEELHLIFLSHSGNEKPFVERLDKALRSAGHDPFFDKISLPLGEKFPRHILDNARKCKLGVLVLSPGFLKSKWPMVELHAMYTYKPRPAILPLFFKVRPNDVKPSSPIFSEWKTEWEAFEKNDPHRIKSVEWESAMEVLSSTHGVVYQPGMTEEQFIAKVVWGVSSIVRPLLHYDVSHLIGHERITQVVADLFETAPKAPHLKAARALGFYGIGGLGKTAACKLMINYYGRGYLGRCALIEFPSTGCTKEIVARQCHAALERLALPQADELINTHKRDDLDECLQRLRKQGATGQDVFIAIDNVWEESLKFAQRILDIGFSSGSTVMVTSRSMPVLLNLLKDKSCVKPLPGLTEDDACKLFEDTFHRNQGVHGVELEGATVQNVTKSLCYGGVFHPLAISAAGTSLGRFGGEGWQAAWDSKKPLSFTGSGSDTDKAIKLNFESIPKSRQDMFLDVALIYIPEIQQSFDKLSPSILGDPSPNYRPTIYNMLLRAWLTAVNLGVMQDAREISAALEQLAYDGLVEFDGSQVRVHDLYKDMASRAAQVSHRFVLPLGDCSSPRGINHVKVERMLCQRTSRQSDILGSVKEFRNLCKLRVLLVETFQDWTVVHMPEVRVLRVQTGQLKFKREGWRMRQGGWGEYMPNLAWLHLEIRGGDFAMFGLDKAISLLRNLRVLILDGGDEHSWLRLNIDDDDLAEGGMSPIVHGAVNFCLEGLVNLQILSIRRVEDLGEISGLDSLENLELVSVIIAPSLLRVGKFRSCSKKLHGVVFDRCFHLKEVVGIANLESLRQLCLQDVRVLPDLRAMAALEGLILGRFKRSAADHPLAVRVNIHGLPNLTKLSIRGDGITVEEIGGLPRLKDLVIKGSDNKVLNLSRLRNLPHLERLFIAYCRELREIEWSSLNDLANLQVLGVAYCPGLQRLRGEPAGMNHTLRRLPIKFCPSFQEIEGRHLLSESCTVVVV